MLPQFLFVQRGVSTGQQLINRAGVVRIVACYAHTDRQLIATAPICVAGIEVLLQTSTQYVGTVLTDFYCDNRKLIPANTSADVRLSKCLFEYRVSIDQRQVSLLMAQAIIDLFHVVQIGK